MYNENSNLDLVTSLMGARSGPSGALEEFLLTDLDQLVDHQRVLAFVIYRYKMGIQRCNQEIRDYTRALSDANVTALQYWRDQKQSTGKPYSFDEAKEMRKGDPTVRQYSALLDQVTDRKEALTAYLDALRVKVSLSPGLQGLFNRIADE